MLTETELNLPNLERRILIDGLREQEVQWFRQIAEKADDRCRWENPFAHAEDAEAIVRLAEQIVLLAARREALTNKNDEQEKHS